MAPVIIVIAAVAWVGVRGLLAKSALEEAQALVGDLKVEAAAMNLTAIEPIYRQISEHTANARSLTSDPVWLVGEWVPFVGKNLEVVRVLAEATDDVMVAVEPLVELASELDPASLAPQDGAIPLDPFIEAGPLVVEAETAISDVNGRVLELDVSGTVGPVANARERFVGVLSDVAIPLAAAKELVPMIPALLGADGPRTYVVMFQNNAEARSLGGTALSFARITIDHGRIQLEESVPAGFGNFPAFDVSPVPVPDGFDSIYPGAFGRYIPNATLRPDFPSAAEIVFQNWVRHRGITPDAVVSLDAVALSYLLRATGPITLSTGDEINSSNAVSFLLNQVLLRTQTGDAYEDNRLQDQVYGETVSQTFGKLSDGTFDVPIMMSAMLQAFSERRMAIWSAISDEQERIGNAGMDSSLPASDDESDAIGVYVNDNVGSKLNYYLTATLATSSAACTADGRQVHRLSLALNNLVDPATIASLGPSILGGYQNEGLEPGVQRMILFVYAPPGSAILGATVGGQPIELEPLHDTDHPVARIVIAPAPGATTTVSVDILMGSPGLRELDLHMTPLVKPVERTSAALDCGTVVVPAA